MSVPTSHALIKASSLLCFLGFAIAFFLLQVQQSLIDVDATTAVRILVPHYSEFVTNIDVVTG